MWLSHDSSSEYALEIGELRLYYASIYNRIIVLKTAETTFFTFHSLINIPVAWYNYVFQDGKKLFAIGTYSFNRLKAESKDLIWTGQECYSLQFVHLVNSIPWQSEERWIVIDSSAYRIVHVSSKLMCFLPWLVGYDVWACTCMCIGMAISLWAQTLIYHDRFPLMCACILTSKLFNMTVSIDIFPISLSLVLWNFRFVHWWRYSEINSSDIVERTYTTC
jgi:hypothetical protein